MFLISFLFLSILVAYLYRVLWWKNKVSWELVKELFVAVDSLALFPYKTMHLQQIIFMSTLQWFMDCVLRVIGWFVLSDTVVCIYEVCDCWNWRLTCLGVFDWILTSKFNLAYGFRVCWWFMNDFWFYLHYFACLQMLTSKVLGYNLKLQNLTYKIQNSRT